jgi:hypothetical protein
MGRRGEVWDREGEEGMRVIQRKEMGRKEGKGREGRKEGKEEDNLAPPNKIPGSATDSQCAASSASIFDKCCHSKNAVNFMNALTRERKIN